MEPDEKIIKMLVDTGKVRKKDLISVFKIHKANKAPLEKLVVELGVAKEEDVMEVKAGIFNARPYFIDLEKIDKDVAKQIPKAMAERYLLICPEETPEGKLVIAMHDPNDSFALEYVQMRTGKEIEPYVTLLADLDNAWDEIYAESKKKKHPFFKKSVRKIPKRKIIPEKLSLPGLSSRSRVVVNDSEKVRSQMQEATEKLHEKARDDEKCLEMFKSVRNEIDVLSTLSRSVGFLNSKLSEQEVVTRILETGLKVCNADGASILMKEEDDFHLYFREALGPRSNQLKTIRIPLNDQSIAGWVLLNETPLAVSDVSDDPRHYKKVDKTIDFTTHNLACVPLKYGDEVVGVLEIVNKKDGDFNEKDLEYLTILADQASVALRNSIIMDQFQNFYMEVVEILIDCLETLDPYNRSHALEVARLSSAIAKEAHMSGNAYENLCYAAFLHDLGMIKVTEENIEEHPVHGARMLSQIKFFSEVAPIVRHHHERYDGQGYPDGFAGESIPMGARILAVVEAFMEGRSQDTYENDREYLQNFLSLFGTAFDPNLKLAFMSAVEHFISDADSEEHLQIFTGDDEEDAGEYVLSENITAGQGQESDLAVDENLSAMRTGKSDVELETFTGDSDIRGEESEVEIQATLDD